jgi:nitrite reductase (NO-forming)
MTSTPTVLAERTTTATGKQERSLRSWPQDTLRIAFGVIWLIDAVLKWLPGFRSAYVADITGAAKGQPGWLNWWFNFWVKLQTPRPTFFAYFVAVLETLIALALIFGFARKLSYVLIAVFSFLMWGVAEGFGGPYMKGSTDIGTSIIYVVVALGLLVVAYYAGTSRYSLDHYIEEHISWWWKVAEVGHPAPIARTSSTVNQVPDPPADLGSVGSTNGKPKEPVLQ